MTTSHTSTYHEAVQRPVTLNDLRVRSYITEHATSNSAVALSGMILVAVLAVGAFVMVDPLGMYSSPNPAPAAPAHVAPVAPAAPALTNEIVLRPLPATIAKSVEPPAAQAPAARTPVTRAPAARAPAAKRGSSTATSETRNNTEEVRAAPVPLESAVEIKDAPKRAIPADAPPATE